MKSKYIVAYATFLSLALMSGCGGGSSGASIDSNDIQQPANDSSENPPTDDAPEQINGQIENLFGISGISFSLFGGTASFQLRFSFDQESTFELSDGDIGVSTIAELFTADTSDGLQGELISSGNRALACAFEPNSSLQFNCSMSLAGESSVIFNFMPLDDDNRASGVFVLCSDDEDLSDCLERQDTNPDGVGDFVIIQPNAVLAARNIDDIFYDYRGDYLLTYELQGVPVIERSGAFNAKELLKRSLLTKQLGAETKKVEVDILRFM